MKCEQCLFEGDCSLRKIASDLTGCEGHSKERPPHKGEVKCSCCQTWVQQSEAFNHKINGKYICFKCY